MNNPGRVENLFMARGNGDAKTGVVHTPIRRAGSRSFCHQPGTAPVTVHEHVFEMPAPDVH